MSYTSISSMLDAARLSSKPLYAVICEDDCRENGYSPESSHRQIGQLWDAMRQSSMQYRAADRSNSGFIGGDAAKFRTAAEKGTLLGNVFFARNGGSAQGCRVQRLHEAHCRRAYRRELRRAAGSAHSAGRGARSGQ